MSFCIAIYSTNSSYIRLLPDDPGIRTDTFACAQVTFEPLDVQFAFSHTRKVKKGDKNQPSLLAMSGPFSSGNEGSQAIFFHTRRAYITHTHTHTTKQASSQLVLKEYS